MEPLRARVQLKRKLFEDRPHGSSRSAGVFRDVVNIRNHQLSLNLSHRSHIAGVVEKGLHCCRHSPYYHVAAEVAE